jgi:hypothetical protein
VQQQSNEAAETVAQYIKGTLENHGLLRKCILLAGDNCNTMFGDCSGMRKGKMCVQNSLIYRVIKH